MTGTIIKFYLCRKNGHKKPITGKSLPSLDYSYASEEQTCDMQAFAKWLSERADKSLVDNVVDFVKTIIDIIQAYTKTGKYHATELAMLNLEKEKAEEFSKMILEEYD